MYKIYPSLSSSLSLSLFPSLSFIRFQHCVTRFVQAPLSIFQELEVALASSSDDAASSAQARPKTTRLFIDTYTYTYILNIYASLHLHERRYMYTHILKYLFTLCMI